MASRYDHVDGGVLDGTESQLLGPSSKTTKSSKPRETESRAHNKSSLDTVGRIANTEGQMASQMHYYCLQTLHCTITKPQYGHHYQLDRLLWKENNWTYDTSYVIIMITMRFVSRVPVSGSGSKWCWFCDEWMGHGTHTHWRYDSYSLHVVLWCLLPDHSIIGCLTLLHLKF